ncbi:MAG: glycosyltransferase family 4 protein [Candidatus Obscuribacterales bacterium]|nr:glycosyltransferase family 4 protein [Candidatus Obscuribacterales bacterium]
MRILVNDYPGHSFPLELSRYLATQGHQVQHTYFASIIAPRGDLSDRRNEPPNLKILGLSLKEPFQKYNFAKRLLQEIEYGQLLAQTVKSFKPDVVLSGSTPLDVQRILWQTCKKLGIKRVFWLQDLQGQAIHSIFHGKWFGVGSLLGNYYNRLEGKLLKDSNAVIAITEHFLPAVEKQRVKANQISIIPNWAVLSELPVHSKINPWSTEHSLSNSFVFLYSGTLGLKHNPELLVRLAQHFPKQPQVKIVVISQGLGADWLKKQKEELGLDNLLLLDFQPFALMPQVLATADVLISILEPEASSYSVPSKVLSYLCAQRPLLLSMPKNNLAAKIVLENKAGLVAETGEEFIAQAQELFTNPQMHWQIANNARAYAERTFDITKIGSCFSEIFERLTK